MLARETGYGNAVPTKTHYSWQPYFILLLIITERLFHSFRISQNFWILFTQNFSEVPGAGSTQTHYSWQLDLCFCSLYLTNTNINTHINTRMNTNRNTNTNTKANAGRAQTHYSWQADLSFSAS